jgi:hypothetical protein
VSVPGLSPDGALAWLASLSIDLRATAVLDVSGAVVAGDPALGPHALARVARCDLVAAAAALEGT